MSTLAVRNVAQKILFEEELCGQISDGRWENARPSEHWRDWSDATVIVDPSNVGRDFYARKSNYNFTDPMLLSVVGNRMLEAVRQQIPSYTEKQMRKDLRDLKWIVRIARQHLAVTA